MYLRLLSHISILLWLLTMYKWEIINIYYMYVCIQVTVNPSRTRSYVLTPSRQSVANALGCNAHWSFAKHAVRNYIVTGLQ